MSELSCATVQDHLPEAALGLLDEPERTAVLAHLGTCRNCRAEFDELVRVNDRLVALAPEVDPPPGFGQRVLARMEADGAPTAVPVRRRAPRWIAVAAAVAVALGAGVAIGVALDGDDDRGALAAIGIRSVAALRTDDGEEVGRLALTGEAAPVALVQLERSRAGVPYRCELVLADGTVVDMGEWTLPDDDGGSYSVALPWLAARPTEARVLRADGSVWLSGTLA